MSLQDASDSILRTSVDLMKENRFILKKKKKGKQQTIFRKKASTDADYADNLAHLANTPAQAESLLHNLEQLATGIGLRKLKYNRVHII